MVFSVPLSGILSPKKTAVSYLCCFCHVDHPDNQPRSQGLSSSRPVSRSMGREEERPWERGCLITVVKPAVSGAVMFCIGPYGEADAARLFCIANLLRKIVTKQ